MWSIVTTVDVKMTNLTRWFILKVLIHMIIYYKICIYINVNYDATRFFIIIFKKSGGGPSSKCFLILIKKTTKKQSLKLNSKIFLI